MLPNHRFRAVARGRSIVFLCRDIVPAGFGVKLNPIRGWSASDKSELILLEAKQNAVANHIAVVAAWNELLGPAGGEVGKTVEGEMRQQLERVGPLHVLLHHMVRLIEKNAGLPPGSLLVAPVRELWRDHRIDVGSDF